MSKPLLLVVAEREELTSEESFFDPFREFAAGRWDLRVASVMDAYMTPPPPGVSLTVVSLGLLSPLHLELIDKIRLETGRPVLVHLTDDHPETRKHLDSREGVVRLKKPASLHQVVDLVDRLLEDPRRTPAAPPRPTT